MSDETQGTASQPAEGEVQPVNPEAEHLQVTTAQQEGAEGEQQADEAGEKPDGDKPERKRLSTAEKHKRRQTFLLNQLAEKDRELAELRQSRGNNGEQSDADRPPREEDFNGDWQAWQDAKTAHAVKQAVREENRRQNDSKRSADHTAELRERIAEHEELCDEAREVITDFDKVVATVKGVSEPLAYEVLHSEKGHLIKYHLAQHPEEFNKLNGLHGPALAREIGRLEAKLELPAAKKQTTAPAPLKPLKGGASGSFDAKNASMDDYVAKRAGGWNG